MSKVIKPFYSKQAARDFIKAAKEKYRCIVSGNVYQAGGHYHAMLTGDITAEIAEQLKGRTQKGFIFDP